jgi:hypothetical protein
MSDIHIPDAGSDKGKHVDLKRVGQKLCVRYVHEGSVQRGGNRMLGDVQLIDSETGNHLWAERFDSPLLRPLRLPASTLSEFPTKIQQPSFPSSPPPGSTAARRAVRTSRPALSQGSKVRAVPQRRRPCVASHGLLSSSSAHGKLASIGIWLRANESAP